MKLMSLLEHWLSRNQARETRDTLVNTVSMMMTHGGAELMEHADWQQATQGFIDAMHSSRKRIGAPAGRMAATLADNYRHFGIFPLKLTIENLSFEDWNTPNQNPLTVRYRLSNAEGEVKIKAGPNKRLPGGVIAKRQSREFDLTLDIDPDEAQPGDILTLTLYQHGTGWFDQHGFTPAELRLPA